MNANERTSYMNWFDCQRKNQGIWVEVNIRINARDSVLKYIIENEEKFHLIFLERQHRVALTERLIQVELKKHEKSFPKQKSTLSHFFFFRKFKMCCVLEKAVEHKNRKKWC